MVHTDVVNNYYVDYNDLISSVFFYFIVFHRHFSQFPTLPSHYHITFSFNSPTHLYSVLLCTSLFLFSSFYQCRSFKGWLALSSPSNKTTNGVWYVHVQVQLSYLLQAIELPPIFSSQKPSEIVSKLKRTNSQPYLQTLNVRTNTNTTSNSMLDLFGSSNTTSFTSSIPSTPYDVLSHSRSQSSFPTLSDSLFGVQSNNGTPSRERERQKDANKDKNADKSK